MGRMGMGDLLALAARQHGLFSVTDARDCRVTRGMVLSGLRAGRWRSVRRGVYQVAGAPRTWRQDVLANCLCAGSGSLAGDLTAIHLWGLDPRRPKEIAVVTEHRRQSATVHSRVARDILPMDRQWVHGIPVTSVDRTLIDVARLVDERLLGRLTDRALRRHLVSFVRLAYRFERIEQRGRPGVAAMRRVLEDRRGRPTLDSDAEADFLDLVKTYSVPGPMPQYWIKAGEKRRRLDFAYLKEAVAIEIEGPHHDEFGQLEDDRERQNAITNAGWRVYRFSPRTVRSEPYRVACTICEALALPAPRPRKRRGCAENAS